MWDRKHGVEFVCQAPEAYRGEQMPPPDLVVAAEEDEAGVGVVRRLERVVSGQVADVRRLNAPVARPQHVAETAQHCTYGTSGTDWAGNLKNRSYRRRPCCDWPIGSRDSPATDRAMRRAAVGSARGRAAGRAPAWRWRAPSRRNAGGCRRAATTRRIRPPWPACVT